MKIRPQLSNAEITFMIPLSKDTLIELREIQNKISDSIRKSTLRLECIFRGILSFIKYFINTDISSVIEETKHL